MCLYALTHVGHIRIEMTKTPEEKWGLAIAKNASGMGGLHVKDEPALGSPAHNAVGELKLKGWLIAMVNDVDATEFGTSDIR
jgi:hypothetical protein